MIAIGIFGTFIVIVMVYVAFMIRWILDRFHWTFVKGVLATAFRADLHRRYAPERQRKLARLMSREPFQYGDRRGHYG